MRPIRGSGSRLLILLSFCLFAGCAVQPKPPVVRDGKVFGETEGWIWRPTWWNYYQRGVSFAEGEIWDEAIDDLGRAIELRPEDARIGRTYGMHFVPYFPHRELGVIFYRLGMYPDSVRHLERSLDSVDSAKAAFYLNQARRALLLESGADLAPPAIDVQWPPEDTLTRDLSLEVRGTVRDEGFVAGISVADSKVPVFLAEPTISFASEVPLDPGLNIVRIAAHDLVGRTARVERRVQVDWAGPLLCLDPVTGDGSGAFLPVRVSGEVRDRSGIRSLEVGGVSLDGVSGTSLRFAESLVPDPGQRFVELRAEDLAGNVTHARVELPPASRAGHRRPLRVAQADPPAIVIDDRGPVWPWILAAVTADAPVAAGEEAGNAGLEIALAEDPDGLTVFGPGLYLEGRVSGPSAIRSLTVAGRQLLERPGTHVFFGYLVELREGENRIRVEAEDARGRRASRTVRVTRRVPRMLQVAERMRLSLLPFQARECREDRTRLLEEDLRVAFVRQGRFSLVERERLEEVLRERRIAAEGLAGRKAAARVGRLAAADAMVMGWATETPGDIELVTRLIDVETSEVLLTLDAYGQDKSPEALGEMMTGLAHRFRQGFPLVEGSVVRCESKRCYLDAGQDAGLRPGQKLLFFRPGPAVPRDSVPAGTPGEMQAVGAGRLEDVHEASAVARLARRQGLEGPRPSDRFITK